MNTVYNADNLNILTRELSTSIVLRNKICQLCQRPQWEASLNQHVGISPHTVAQKKICCIFQAVDTRESVLAGEILKYLCTARLTRLTLDMCPPLSTSVQSSVDIIEEVFLQYALVRIIESVFLLNFIFSKII